MSRKPAELQSASRQVNARHLQIRGHRLSHALPIRTKRLLNPKFTEDRCVCRASHVLLERGLNTAVSKCQKPEGKVAKRVGKDFDNGGNIRSSGPLSKHSKLE